MMENLYRQGLTHLIFTLQSGEELGLLGSGSYVEDYFGVGGRVALRHLPSGAAFPLPLAELRDETPAIANDIFRGMIPLAGLPSGDYEMQGRVRDRAGNHTVIGAVASPRGGERVIAYRFRLSEGFGVLKQSGGVRLEGAARGPALTVSSLAVGASLHRSPRALPSPLSRQVQGGRLTVASGPAAGLRAAADSPAPVAAPSNSGDKLAEPKGVMSR